MSGLDLANGTVAGFAGLLESGELSPVELTQATLERIERLDGPLKGFTTVTAEYALERARKAEEEIRRGDYRGPLHGIPYTLKDLIDTVGIRTTYGYKSHEDYVPQTSARVHELMEEAGGILVGKVNCHFRRDVAVTCFNPWDVSRSPGHSSAGFRAGGGSGNGIGVYRVGHGWIGADSGGVDRGGGSAGDLRVDKSAQSIRAVVVVRPGGAPGEDGGGYGVDAAGSSGA